MAMDRRHLVSGGLMAGVGAALGTAPAAAAPQRGEDERTAAALDRLRESVDRGLLVSPELIRIREQQRAFLKANHKFPDYIEVGIGIWESVYDWHVRHQRPLEVLRTVESRYAMRVMETLLVLRPEQTDSYVGFGFDAR